MTAYDRRGHVQPPRSGLWTPILDADMDFASDDPLSDEAAAVRSAGLSFPMYGAPDASTLQWVIAERARKAGSKRRPLGRDAIQNAHSELRAKGYFAWRKIQFGKKQGAGPKWVTIRSYANDPWEHVEILNSLPVSEVVWHYRRMEVATAYLGPSSRTEERRVVLSPEVG